MEDAADEGLEGVDPALKLAHARRPELRLAGIEVEAGHGLHAGAHAA